MYYIYKLVFKETDKFYIGQTRNLDQRYDRHWNDLVKGCHHNIHLQRWFNKHKPSFMGMIVISTHETKLGSDSEEVSLIEETYDVNFNISKKAQGGDLISYHPNKKDIAQKHRENYYKQVSSGEREPFHPKFGEDNPNYKHGRQTKDAMESATCIVCKIHPVRTVGTHCKECLSILRSTKVVGEGNPFFGKKHTEDTKQKLSECRKNMYEQGKLPANVRKVVAEGKVFESCAECARFYKVSNGLITYRIKNVNWDFEYFDEVVHNNLLSYSEEFDNIVGINKE